MELIKRHIVYLPRDGADFGHVVCYSQDVRELEELNAELLEALQDAIALYGKFGAIVNDPNNPGEWITKAQEAVRRATE